MTQPPSGFKNKRNTPFTMLANTMLRDPSLSLKAKGLLGVMLSFPDGWQYYLKHLETLSTDGRDAHRAAIRELEDAGYIQREQARDEYGHLSNALYRVSDAVLTVDGFPGAGLSGAGETGAGKPDTIKKEVKKTESRKNESSARAVQNTPGTADASEVRIPERLENLPGFGLAWDRWLTYKGAAYAAKTGPVQLALDFLNAQPDPLEVIAYAIRSERDTFSVKPSAPARPGRAPVQPVQVALQDDGEIDMDALLRAAPLNGAGRIK